MIPGTYNPIWQYISVDKIQQEIFEGWSRGVLPPRLANSRIIKVLLRPANLGLHANKSNKLLLASDDYALIESDLSNED